MLFFGAVGFQVAAAGAAEDSSERSSMKCGELANAMQNRWPDASTRIVSVAVNAPGPITPSTPPGAPLLPPVMAPEHCEVVAVMHERRGVDGQPYSIRFHLRLPIEWNGRFFFQGGAGSNGVLGDALGLIAPGVPPALLQGFAVVSQDSGHDSSVNFDQARGGVLAFGFDPQARADYGHASLKVVAAAAKAAIAAYYGKPARYSYFVGCSKGGQEGMTFAQQHPEEFDGIVAGAPGFSLPRAALAQAWDVQRVAEAEQHSSPAPSSPGEKLEGFSSVFTDADLALVRDSILEACDADDGLRDGIVGDFDRCTTRKVAPRIRAMTCRDPTGNCLSPALVSALLQIFAGPKDDRGRPLYSDWPWDPGIASPGWRLWKLGSADGKVPALNISLGGPSLAAVFTTPPTMVPADLESILGFQLAFNLAHDAARVDATTVEFPRSAWQDIAARSSDLRQFRARGGKLIVPHGVADPVFSIRDTLQWYGEVQHRSAGEVAGFVRVFAVPGMNHCGGGPATDGFDAFAALRDWVENKHAPERIPATAGPGSPWPGRMRPLCPYPKIARYNGRGDIESESSFECR